jgi:hypothetical protein
VGNGKKGKEMKIGKLEISGYKQMTYSGQPLNMPHVIIWKAFWAIPYYILIGLTYIVLLIGQGKYTADDFIGNL